MSRIRSLITAAASLALVTLPVQAAHAQAVLSPAGVSVQLQGIKVERITLDLSTTTLIANTDLAANNRLGTLNATMGWALNPSRGNVYLVGWFSSTTALTDGSATPNIVSTADFLGTCTATNMTGATCANTPMAFDQGADAAVGSTAGASRVLWSSAPIAGANRSQTGIYAGLMFEIRSSAVAALPAGTYTGTLNMRAYAQ